MAEVSRYRFLYRSTGVLVIANLVFASVIRDEAETLEPFVGDYRTATFSPSFDELLLADIVVELSDSCGRALRAFVACL